MKFALQLRNALLRDWSLYYINYDELKKIIKLHTCDASRIDVAAAQAAFFPKLEEELTKACRFFCKRLDWSTQYAEMLTARVQALRTTGHWTLPDDAVDSGQDSVDEGNQSSDEEDNSNESQDSITPQGTPTVDFEQFLYAKKTLVDFQREIKLLQEFAFLNREGVRKIVKKFDRHVGTAHLTGYMAKQASDASRQQLWSSEPEILSTTCEKLLDGVAQCRPELNEREGRKVITIGCFDLFHRGHENLLRMLREFGTFVVVGIHDDGSYYELKKKRTIDDIKTRVRNVMPLVDNVFVIPDTDPTLWLQAMVSKQDMEARKVCYVRGEDMLDFPGRTFIEQVMPVYFLPRSEGVSSTLLRTIAFSEDPTVAQAAAFADTDATGKPILTP